MQITNHLHRHTNRGQQEVLGFTPNNLSRQKDLRATGAPQLFKHNPTSVPYTSSSSSSSFYHSTVDETAAAAQLSKTPLKFQHTNNNNNNNYYSSTSTATEARQQRKASDNSSSSNSLSKANSNSFYESRIAQQSPSTTNNPKILELKNELSYLKQQVSQLCADVPGGIENTSTHSNLAKDTSFTAFSIGQHNNNNQNNTYHGPPGSNKQSSNPNISEYYGNSESKTSILNNYSSNLNGGKKQQQFEFANGCLSPAPVSQRKRSMVDPYYSNNSQTPRLEANTELKKDIIDKAEEISELRKKNTLLDCIVKANQLQIKDLNDRNQAQAAAQRTVQEELRLQLQKLKKELELSTQRENTLLAQKAEMAGRVQLAEARLRTLRSDTHALGELSEKFDSMRKKHQNEKQSLEQSLNGSIEKSQREKSELERTMQVLKSKVQELELHRQTAEDNHRECLLRKDKEIGVLKQEVAILHKLAGKNTADENAERERLAESLKTRDQQIARLTHELQNKVSQLRNQQNTLLSLKQLLQSKQASIADMHRQLGLLRLSVQNETEMRLNLEHELNSLHSQYTQQTQQLRRDFSQRQQALLQEREEMSQNSHRFISQLQSQVENLTAANQNLLKCLAEANCNTDRQSATLAAEVEALRRTVEGLRSDNQQLVQQRQQLKDSVLVMTRQYEEASQAHLIQKNHQIQLLNSALSKAQADLEEKQAQVCRWRTQLKLQQENLDSTTAKLLGQLELVRSTAIKSQPVNLSGQQPQQQQLIRLRQEKDKVFAVLQEKENVLGSLRHDLNMARHCEDKLRITEALLREANESIMRLELTMLDSRLACLQL